MDHRESSNVWDQLGDVFERMQERRQCLEYQQKEMALQYYDIVFGEKTRVEKTPEAAFTKVMKRKRPSLEDHFLQH